MLSEEDINTQRPAWHKAHGQLDMGLGFQFNSQIKGGLRAYNALGGDRVEQMGPQAVNGLVQDPNSHNNSWRENGREYTLFLRGDF